MRLPQKLPVEVGDVLMVREEFSDHPRTRQLLRKLLDHLAELAAPHSELVWLVVQKCRPALILRVSVGRPAA